VSLARAKVGMIDMRGASFAKSVFADVLSAKGESDPVFRCGHERGF